MGAFVVAANAVTPFLVYFCLGWICRKSGLVTEAFLQEMNQFVFRCFFPITMFYNTHAIQVSIAESSRLIMVCAGLLTVVFTVSLAVVPRLVKEDARRGVIIQCLNRSNLVLFALGLTRLETFVCLTMYATPVAASAYTMSQNMGGDGEPAVNYNAAHNRLREVARGCVQ